MPSKDTAAKKQTALLNRAPKCSSKRYHNTKKAPTNLTLPSILNSIKQIIKQVQPMLEMEMDLEKNSLNTPLLTFK